MTKKISLLFVFLNFVFNLFSQEYNVLDTARFVAKYDYTFQEDSLNINSVKNNEMILLLGDKISGFHNYSQFLFEAQLHKDPELSIQKIIEFIKSRPVPSFLASFTVLKNYPKLGSLTILPKIVTNSFMIEESLKIKWKLSDEKQSTVAGYPCKKATTHFAGRDYEAWYTLEIPISDGPYKFNGLPGLIVEIEDTKGEHRFLLTDFKKVKKDEELLIMYEDTKKIKGNMTDFLKAQRNYSNGGTKSLQSENIPAVKESKKLKIVKRMKSRNNFIEKLKE